MRLITITYYRVLITLITFSRSWVHRSSSQTTFSENALFQRRSAYRSTVHWRYLSSL